jgi:thiol-disulfide isomerase/thioredoxin
LTGSVIVDDDADGNGDPNVILNFATTVGLLLSVSATPGETLDLGQPAPPLTVAEWIKGQPVREFKKGHVYVVEFWATWCGPCIGNIPHLTAIQQKYGDRVTVVGVSIWEEDQKPVIPFVEKLGGKMDYVGVADGHPGAGWPGPEARSGTRPQGGESCECTHAGHERAIPRHARPDLFRIGRRR